MRKAKVFSETAVLPRMSWSPKNLYNLIARSTVPYYSAQTSFTKSSLTMYQQRWRSKRFLRGYHGDWIPERRFKRWFLPIDLPRFEQPANAAIPKAGGPWDKRNASGAASSFATGGGQERLPAASLFMREVERRIDVVVFRCCFARSAYEARGMVVQGKVSLNGVKVTDPNTQLSPGDLISVEPTAIPMLSSKLADAAAKAAAKLEAEVAEKKAQAAAERAQEQGESGEADSDAAPPAETQAAEPVKAEGEASAESVEASSEKAAEVQETSESSEKDATVSAQSAEATPASSDATSSTKEKTKGAASAEQREEGVLPFTLPHYAAPFLFIPPYLEPSFTTCSAIYLRHPTIVPHRVSSSSSERSESGNYSNNSNSSRLPTYRTDIPSPYPAGGEMFTMAWEHYARDAPRVRGELRREKMEAQGGRKGFSSARAKDVHTQRNAIRRGWGRRMET